MTSAKISNFRFSSKNADVINFLEKIFLEMKDIHKLYLRAKFELIWINIPRVKEWGHEKFFSSWCNATCSIPSTQEKKCVSHGFNFCFMGQKVRGIPKRHADFVPGTMEQNCFKSILLHCRRDKSERNFVPCQKKAFFCRVAT